MVYACPKGVSDRRVGPPRSETSIRIAVRRAWVMGHVARRAVVAVANIDRVVRHGLKTRERLARGLL